MTYREADARFHMVRYIQDIRELLKDNPLHYKGITDFLHHHGQWHDVVPIRSDVRQGLPRHCFGNAIMLAVTRKWKYIEGLASPRIAVPVPVHHAWNLDEKNRLVDSTWMNTGGAYLGVEFSVERADEATWDGDASVLNDWHRGYPLFQQPWPGETPENAVPASERIILLREGKTRELWQLLERTEPVIAQQIKEGKIR